MNSDNVTAMTHAQWHSKIKRALALAERKPKNSLQILDKLARDVEAQILISLQDWHLAQTLGVTSIVQSSVGDYRSAARILTRIAEQHESALKYQSRALVSTCAAAALELAKAGDRRVARQMLRKASVWSHSVRPKDRLLVKAEKLIQRPTKLGMTS
jgi:hypothetical protein